MANLKPCEFSSLEGPVSSDRILSKNYSAMVMTLSSLMISTIFTIRRSNVKILLLFREKWPFIRSISVTAWPSALYFAAKNLTLSPIWRRAQEFAPPFSNLSSITTQMSLAHYIFSRLRASPGFNVSSLPRVHPFTELEEPSRFRRTSI